MPAVFKPLTRNMLDVDEPDHTRLRGLVSKAFTPGLVERMRDRIQSLADQLLARALRKRHVDLLADYALPIPTTVIAEMLGIPAEDRHKFQRWSRAIVGITPNSWGMLLAIPHVWMFLRYIRGQIQLRKKEPREDLLTALVQAEETGERLSEDELVAMVFLLLIAGHETTVNLIGNGVLCLLEHPAQLAQLRSEEVAICSAVEELLRFASPVETATERFALEDLEVCGTAIRRGELAFAAIASANRDETVFREPQKCDLGRDPNKHLSFGLGSHYCLGAALARLEGQIAIGSLIRQAPGLRLAVPADRLVWRKGLVLRGLEQLPVILE
jgi:cytochrome P450 PksS